MNNSFKQWDGVILPRWFRLRKRQARVNVILSVAPEPGRGYIFMAKVLQNGKVSSDRAATVYFPYENASSLRRMDKHEFDTDCSNESCLYHELAEMNPAMVCPRCNSDMDIVRIAVL